MDIIDFYRNNRKNSYDEKERQNEQLKKIYNIRLLCDICSKDSIFHDCGSYCHGMSFERSLYKSIKLKIRNKIFDWLDSK